MTRILPLVLVVSMVALAGCGSSEPAAPRQGEAPADTTGDSQGDGCAEGGVPDDGVAQGCDFRVEGCCYSVAAHACAAAGCTEDRCTILESYPAQVRCP